jgi:hypothetical protein
MNPNRKNLLLSFLLLIFIAVATKANRFVLPPSFFVRRKQDARSGPLTVRINPPTALSSSFLPVVRARGGQENVLETTAVIVEQDGDAKKEADLVINEEEEEVDEEDELVITEEEEREEEKIEISVSIEEAETEEYEYEEEYYADSEEEEVGEEEVGEKEEGYDTEVLDQVVETAIILSKKTSILALKASKISAIWLKRWSLDLYYACERAIYAGRDELENMTDDDALIDELSDSEDSEAAKSLQQKAKRVTLQGSKKLWRISKRLFGTATKMTIAFWSYDDDEFIVDTQEEVEMSLPAISFFSKFKLHTEKEDHELPGTSSLANSVTKCRVVGGGDSTTTITPETTKTKRYRRRRVAKEEPATVVTVIPRTTRKRDVFAKVVIGIASILLWETAGAKTVLLGAVNTLMSNPKLQRSMFRRNGDKSSK